MLCRCNIKLHGLRISATGGLLLDACLGVSLEPSVGLVNPVQSQVGLLRGSVPSSMQTPNWRQAELRAADSKTRVVRVRTAPASTMPHEPLQTRHTDSQTCGVAIPAYAPALRQAALLHVARPDGPRMPRAHDSRPGPVSLAVPPLPGHDTALACCTYTLSRLDMLMAGLAHGPSRLPRPIECAQLCLEHKRRSLLYSETAACARSRLYAKVAEARTLRATRLSASAAAAALSPTSSASRAALRCASCSCRLLQVNHTATRTPLPSAGRRQLCMLPTMLRACAVQQAHIYPRQGLQATVASVRRQVPHLSISRHSCKRARARAAATSAAVSSSSWTSASSRLSDLLAACASTGGTFSPISALRALASSQISEPKHT